MIIYYHSNLKIRAFIGRPFYPILILFNISICTFLLVNGVNFNNTSEV